MSRLVSRFYADCRLAESPSEPRACFRIAGPCFLKGLMCLVLVLGASARTLLWVGPWWPRRAQARITDLIMTTRRSGLL